MLNQEPQYYDAQQEYRQRYGCRPPKGWSLSDALWFKRPLIDTRPHAEETLFGYVTRWNTAANDRLGVMIAPNAFTDFLKTDAEVPAITNHDKSKGVLAWRSNNSLYLREDSVGLYFELRCPDDTPLRHELWLASLKLPSFGTSFNYALQESEFCNGVTYYLKLSLTEVSIFLDRELCSVAGATAWWRRKGAPATNRTAFSSRGRPIYF
jgi:HK97 family phage prohead protease